MCFRGRHVGGVVAAEVVPELPHPRQQGFGTHQLDGRGRQRLEGIPRALSTDLAAEVPSPEGGKRLDDDVLRPGSVHVPGEFGPTGVADRAVIGERVRQHRRVHDDQASPPVADIDRSRSCVSRSVRA